MASSEADGAASTKKKRLSADSKAEQVEEMKSEPKQTHGAKFNELQYRLWAEVLVLHEIGALSDTEFERERLYYVNKMQELK